MISIFAKRAFLNTNPHNDFISKEESYKGYGHLQRVSSMIRADQIAERLGCRLNPVDRYKNDVCIYVKPHVKKGQNFLFEGKRSYIDIIDGHNLGQVAKKNAQVGVIVCSVADMRVMERVIDNKIVLIPQHHCNFDNVHRNRNVVKRIGVIGTEDSFAHIPDSLKNKIKKLGLELVLYSKFFDRQDIIDFYMNIDIQLVWRPYKKRLSNPLKIVNAMSFGVPTVALDEEAFQEVVGCYLPAYTIDTAMQYIKLLLQSEKDYQEISKTCIERSKDYHIDNIVRLYKNL